jgi:hypothetical protein
LGLLWSAIKRRKILWPKALSRESLKKIKGDICPIMVSKSSISMSGVELRKNRSMLINTTKVFLFTG